MIQFLRHKDIDLKKWDNCIDKAVNGLPYAYSWYLNLAAEEQWDALVLDDYDAVFPLPFKNRLVFKQVYQPFFMQQLGMFYADPQNESQLLNFINSIPAQFRKINLQLNTTNVADRSILKIKKKITHHILLDRPYSSLLENYNANTKRNLKKAKSFKLKVLNNIPPAEMITMRKTYLGDELKGVQDQVDQQRLLAIMEKAISINKGFIRGVYNEINELLACTFFLNSNKHIIYLSAVSTSKGKEQQAMTFLIDNAISEFAGSGKVFDFEGSMIPGIARFYKGFGAEEISFPVIIK